MNRYTFYEKSFHRILHAITFIFLLLILSSFAHTARAENIIINGSFEDGFNGWSQSGGTLGSYPLAVRGAGERPLRPRTLLPNRDTFTASDDRLFTSAPTDGTKALTHDFGYCNSGVVEISQTVTIPASLHAELRFDWIAEWSTSFPGPPPNPPRTFEVHILPTSGGIRTFSIVSAPLRTICATGDRPNPLFLRDCPSGYAPPNHQRQIIDLADFAGQSVQIKFVFTLPASTGGAGHFQLDNVVLDAVSNDPTDEDPRTSRIIKNFMSKRAKLISSNEPDFTRRIYRDEALAGSEPIELSGDAAENNARLGFATSLRQAIASRKKTANASPVAKPNPAAGVDSTPISSGTAPVSGFDIWTRGTWSWFDADSSSGNFGLLFVGADYRFDSGLVVGLLASFDWMDEQDGTNNFSADGTGWMVGPYIVKRLFQNWIFDGRVSYGKSDNTVSPSNTYTDSYDATRWLAAAKLTGDFKFGDIKFDPRASLIYFKETQESFVDSLSNTIPSQTVKLGRLMFGPKISTTLEQEDGSAIMPYLRVEGIWDFKTADLVNLTTGFAASGNDQLRARVDAGLTMRLANGTLMTGEGFYDGIGADDYKAWGVNAIVRFPLQRLTHPIFNVWR